MTPPRCPHCGAVADPVGEMIVAMKAGKVAELSPKQTAADPRAVVAALRREARELRNLAVKSGPAFAPHVEDLAAEADARSDTIRMAHAAAKISSDLAAAEITAALDDAGAPKVYNLEDDTERDIPDCERIRLLGERVHTLRAQVREAADATNYLDALIEAHNALDAIGAPRLADGCVLSLAARIRSLPRWPRNLP